MTNYTELDERRPNGNPAAGLNATDIDKIKRIRHLWADGEAAKTIGSLLNVSPSTVQKYVKGIPQRQSRKLKAEERARLLRGWR